MCRRSPRPRAYYLKAYYLKAYYLKAYYLKAYYLKAYYLKSYYLKAYYLKAYYLKAYYLKAYYLKAYYLKAYYLKEYAAYSQDYSLLSLIRNTPLCVISLLSVMTLPCISSCSPVSRLCFLSFIPYCRRVHVM